jgi:hypothetical protein
MEDKEEHEGKELKGGGLASPGLPIQGRQMVSLSIEFT